MTFKYTPKRGRLIGAISVEEEDELFAITSAGGVIRTKANQIRPSSRATMGVRLVDLEQDVKLLAIDKNVEGEGEEEAQAIASGETTDPNKAGDADNAERLNEIPGVNSDGEDS